MMTRLELLRSAAGKLGPERCEQALQAFGPCPVNDWCGCALAHAYGGACTKEEWTKGKAPPHNLLLALHGNPCADFQDVAALVGLTEDEVQVLSEAHSHYATKGAVYPDAAPMPAIAALEAVAAKIRVGVPAGCDA